MEKKFNQIAYQNEFIQKKYDRINFLIPKGEKATIKERAASKNQSVNAYIYELIKKDMEMSGM
ncbi:MAG: hypothetical protein MRZ36_08150 [Eubacterium sp.]|nr:hypothetical protein [Eubacterium sp.]